MEINSETCLSIPNTPIHNVGRSLHVLRTFLSPAKIDLEGGGGGGVEIVTNIRNEKYIICLEVFKNFSLFSKSLRIFFP